MKEHTRNVVFLLCFVIIVQPWLVQNAYVNVSPEVYDNYDLISDQTARFRYYNTSGNNIYHDPVEAFTANNTFTLTSTLTAQQESDPCRMELHWKSSVLESPKFNDSAFEAVAADRITSILIKIYSDDDVVSGVLNIGFQTSTTSDASLIASAVPYIIANTAGGASEVRIYIPLPVYSEIESEDRFDTAPFRIYLVCDAGADLSQVFTCEIVFEKGADYAAWETYLLWLGLLSFGIAIGMTKMYDMTPSGKRNT